MYLNNYEIEIYPKSKNYSTADKARAKVVSLQKKYDTKIRHIIFPRELKSGEVRYHPVLIGADNIQFIHSGFQVIG